MSTYQTKSQNQEIINLENKIITEINNLYRCLQDPGVCDTSQTNLHEIQSQINNFKTTDEYNAEHANIIRQWNQVLTLRSQLDNKLGELHHLNGSTTQMYQNYTDRTVYTNILWTILGTTVLFFVFNV
jgi:hypothetical protein